MVPTSTACSFYTDQTSGLFLSKFLQLFLCNCVSLTHFLRPLHHQRHLSAVHFHCTVLSRLVGKESLKVSSQQVVSGTLKPVHSLLQFSSPEQTAVETEWPTPPWPGSMSSPWCCCASGIHPPSSCPTPRSSGSCWAAMRRRWVWTGPATRAATGLDEPSAGQTVRRSSSCTTSWGGVSTLLPPTWSTW